MKWKVLVTLLVVGGGACFLLANRYSVVGTNRGAIYKTDRLTGRTWIISGGEQSLVRPTFRDLHPDEWQAQQDAEAKRRDAEAQRLSDEQEAREIERARLAEFRRQRDARIKLTQRAEVWLTDALRIANKFRDLEYEIGTHYDWIFDLRHGVIPTTLSTDESLEVLRYRWTSDELADEARGLLKDQPIGIRVQEITKAAAVLRRYSDPWPPIDEWASFGGKSLSLEDLKDAPLTKKERDRLAEEDDRTLEDWRELAEAVDRTLEEWRELAAASNWKSEQWFYAKFQLIFLLLKTNPLRARKEMDQLMQLTPDSIPQPWAARLRALDRRIDGRSNEGADGQGDGN